MTRRRYNWRARRAFGPKRLTSGERIFAMGGIFEHRMNGQGQSEWRKVRSARKSGSMWDGQ